MLSLLSARTLSLLTWEPRRDRDRPADVRRREPAGKTRVFLEMHVPTTALSAMESARGGLSTAPNVAQVEGDPLLASSAKNPMNVRRLWEHLQKSLYFRFQPGLGRHRDGVLGPDQQRSSTPRSGSCSEARYGHASGRTRMAGTRDHATRRGLPRPPTVSSSSGSAALKFDPFGDAYKNLLPAQSYARGAGPRGRRPRGGGRRRGPHDRGPRPLLLYRSQCKLAKSWLTFRRFGWKLP